MEKAIFPKTKLFLQCILIIGALLFQQSFITSAIGNSSTADDNIPGIYIPNYPYTDTLNKRSDSDDIFAIFLVAGDQIQVSLSGASGTDFDLHLFGPGATDIDLDTPLSSSMNRGTSTESISYNVNSQAGIYYIDVYSYSGNGSYTIDVRITDSSTFSGTATVTRLWGETSEDTSIALSKQGWRNNNSSPVVLIARDDYFTDALAGGPLAKVVEYEYGHHAPILLTPSDRLYNETRNEIRRLGAQKVYVLGGPGALSFDVEDALRDISGVESVIRLWGNTCYGTALSIKAEIGSVLQKMGRHEPQTAIITTGENFPDALAISGPAGSKDMPILLVKPFTSEPQPETKLALQGIDEVIIVGGPGAVHPSLEGWLRNNGYSIINRLWGESEYDTAVDITTTGNSIFRLNRFTTIIARGDYFTDALSSSALASWINLGRGPAPIILVESESIPAVSKQWITQNRDYIFQVYLVGGPGAISDNVKSEIEQTLAQ